MYTIANVVSELTTTTPSVPATMLPKQPLQNPSDRRSRLRGQRLRKKGRFSPAQLCVSQYRTFLYASAGCVVEEWCSNVHAYTTMKNSYDFGSTMLMDPILRRV